MALSRGRFCPFLITHNLGAAAIRPKLQILIFFRLLMTLIFTKYINRDLVNGAFWGIINAKLTKIINYIDRVYIEELIS